VQSGRNSFASLTLPLKDGFEYSVRLPGCRIATTANRAIDARR
jgi:hypothetical protein